MISAIQGKLVKKKDSSFFIDVGGLVYEVLVPVTVFNETQDIEIGSEIVLNTFHYYASDSSKSFPILIGFINEIEKEFFEKFISVSGVGPKAAVRAINKPISEIASAIDQGNISFLKSLPGIGEQRAKEIIAKLQDKVGKFGLIQDSSAPRKPINESSDMESEALQVLEQLQYKKHHAQEMIKKALLRCSNISTSEELLNEVYRQKKDK